MSSTTVASSTTGDNPDEEIECTPDGVEQDLKHIKDEEQAPSAVEKPLAKTKQPPTKSKFSCVRRTRRSLLCFLAILLLLAAAGATIAFFIFRKDSSPVATCGDCWCIPGNETVCPSDAPEHDYPDAVADILATQIPVTPLELYCDPYVNGNCQTIPPQDEVDNPQAVCGIHYIHLNGTIAGTSSLQCVGVWYHLRSYESLKQARTAGAFVTHHGPCGVCSTTQDLAAYLRRPDLTTDGKACSTKGIFSFDEGVECYQQLGFSKSCAAMWTYNGLHTAQHCLAPCLVNIHKPNNGPPPDCALNECLECDEAKSGPIFKQVAGRTRRGSGLLSAIARPCQDIQRINQDACPDTEPLLE